MLGSGFMRGGSSFLKSASSGENKSGGGNINREIRVGVTHVSCSTKHFFAGH